MNTTRMAVQRRTMTYRRRLLRLTVIISGMIVCGYVAAQLVILAINTLITRAGYPGGEILMPLFIVGVPVFTWSLRGWWDSDIRPLFQKKEETEHETY